jgi:hypothetical protein
VRASVSSVRVDGGGLPGNDAGIRGTMRNVSSAALSVARLAAVATPVNCGCLGEEGTAPVGGCCLAGEEYGADAAECGVGDYSLHGGPAGSRLIGRVS